MFLKSIAKSWKSSSAPAQVQPAIVGGAPDLQNVLDKLGPEQSAPDRITAAGLALDSIEKYSVSSIPEIWFRAADMIERTKSPECRRAGLKLMIECIKRDQDLEITKMSLYKAIIATSNIQDFDLHLKAMEALTKDGKEVDKFFVGPNALPNVLDNWFRVLFISTQRTRGSSDDIAKPWGTTTEENFFAFLNFINKIYTHNSVLFTPEDTTNLITRICKTCKKTSSTKDFSICFDIVETIQQTSVIPIDILPDLLEVLCGALITIRSCKAQAQRIILNLVDGDLKVHTFNILLRIITDHSESRKSNTIRGAIRTAQFILDNAAKSEDDEFQYSILLVMNAYAEAARKVDSLGLIYELIACIYDIFSNETCRQKFGNFEVWDSHDCSPFNVLYNISNGNTFNILKSKTIWNQTCSPEAIGLELADTMLKGNDKYVGMIVEGWKNILSLFCQFYESDATDIPKDPIINNFVEISPFVDERCASLVISHFSKSQYCNPLGSDWHQNVTILAQTFFQCNYINGKVVPPWSAEVRKSVVTLICDWYEMAMAIIDSETIKQVLSLVFENVTQEPDIIVLAHLIAKSVDISADAVSPVMDYFSESFIRFFDDIDSATANSSRLSIGSVTSSLMGISIASSGATASNHPASLTAAIISGTDDQRRRLVAIGFCQVFIRTFRTSTAKARSIFDKLVIIARKTSFNDPVSFVEVARLLCRIRSTTDGYIYLTKPTNMDGLSASVGRNLNIMDSASIDKSGLLWWYPEAPAYISESDLNIPSAVLKRRTNQSVDGRSSESDEIEIGKWFDEVLRVIEHGAHWECYSFIWAHFGPQLSNLELFQTSGSSIIRLRQTIVTQLNNIEKLPKVEFPKGVGRNDLSIALIRTVSSLIPYRDMFKKNDSDDIVQALSNGILREKTAIACIHGLMVCCHEFPLSIKKYLGQIFTRLQAKITSINTTPHILEFLLSLSRLPTLVDNFTQEEYKRVFGMAFAYLNSPLNLSRKTNNSSSTGTPDDISASVMSPLLSPPSTLGHAQVSVTSTTNKQLSQYLLSLAYNVVATWFLTLRVENRKYLAKYITRNLIRAGGSIDSVDAQGMAFIDLISRFAFSDIDLTIQTTIEYPSVSDPKRTCQQWIYGASIITVDTDPQSGDTFIVVRRPTGTAMFKMKPDERMIPDWLEEMMLSRNSTKESELGGRGGLRHELPTALTPNYIMLQVMYPTASVTISKPIPLPNDPIVTRAISAFDRIPVVDFHKVGILYIGPGQQNEQEILSNQVGSPRYRKFLENLATLVRLKGNRRIYTGGLDINKDVDGEYAYVWSDKVTQMMFHTTTMMPHTNANDTSSSGKKRHIGNDFINIYFDESELPFKFDVIKSQFNFINIVVTPVSINFSKSAKFMFDEEQPPRSPSLGAQGSHSNFTAQQLAKLASDERMALRERVFYKVRAHCKPDIPVLFAASHLKILSEDSVADFVRNLALMASKFATVWNGNGQYRSNWQLRYDQVETLKQKVNDLAIAEKNKAIGSAQQDSSSDATQQNTSSKGHHRNDSADRNGGGPPDGGVDFSSSFLSQLKTPSMAPAGAGLTTGQSEGSEISDSVAPRAGNRFVMEEPETENFPLLNALEFTSFTQ